MLDIEYILTNMFKSTKKHSKIYKQGEEKIPTYFHLKDNKVFALAGVYDLWSSPSGESIHSCSVITTSANNLVGKIHDRMPVILNSIEAEKAWIGNNKDITKLLTN